MDINFVGICVTVLFGLLALAVATFLGLRGFTSNIGGKLSSLKDDIVMQLSSMNEKMTRVETTMGLLWNLATGYLKGQPGTVTVHLKNFGETKISASVGSDETIYVIQVGQGTLDVGLITRASRSTGFTAKEISMLGRVAGVFPLSSNRLRMAVPCVEPKKCTEYINEFLKWLDVEYPIAAKAFEEFETGIKGPTS